jgi:hypothetical protein
MTADDVRPLLDLRTTESWDEWQDEVDDEVLTMFSGEGGWLLAEGGQGSWALANFAGESVQVSSIDELLGALPPD